MFGVENQSPPYYVPYMRQKDRQKSNAMVEFNSSMYLALANNPCPRLVSIFSLAKERVNAPCIDDICVVHMLGCGV